MGGSTVTKLIILFVMFPIVISVIGIADDIEIAYDDNQLTGDIDCKRCYYSQLEYDFEKDIYDKIRNIEKFEIVDGDSSKCAAFSVVVDDPCLFATHDTEKIKYHVERAVHAALFDMPLNTYFFHRHGINISHWSYPELDIKLLVADDYSEKTKNWYDQQIIHQIDDISADINKLATIPDKIVAIHNYVIDTLSYDYDGWCINQPQDNKTYNIVNRIRSVYNALVGDHRVVCEGYAKMFKVLCDKCDVPCIIVVEDGIVDNDGRHNDHMWNYVCIDGSWYIVDCTWDKQKSEYQTKLSTEYLMSGADVLHQPGSSMNFKVPVLSLNDYGNWVTFMSGDVELFKTVSRHGMISEPAAPEEKEKTFMYWYMDDENEPFDFCSFITTDIILKAKWDEKPVFKNIHDPIGTSNIEYTAVARDDSIECMINDILEKEECMFERWNEFCRKWFEANNRIEMENDMQLYVMWEPIITLQKMQPMFF